MEVLGLKPQLAHCWRVINDDGAKGYIFDENIYILSNDLYALGFVQNHQDIAYFSVLEGFRQAGPYYHRRHGELVYGCVLIYLTHLYRFETVAYNTIEGTIWSIYASIYDSD
jgi:hypothetical protein